jgi:hypothetical protein
LVNRTDVPLTCTPCLFKRSREQPASMGGEVGTLLLQGQEMIAQTARAHADRWGSGTAERWDLDQTTGVLRWSFADKIVEAPAQLLGTYSPAGESWRWAWANESLSPGLRQASDDVRRWGEANAQSMLTQPLMQVTEEHAADLAAIAFRLSGATGFYRTPAGRSIVFMTFGTVTIRRANEAPETFTISVE